MPAFIDRAGQSFGKWTLLSYEGKGRWRAACACGAEHIVRGGNVVNGSSRQCVACADRERLAPQNQIELKRPAVACECGDHIWAETSRWGVALVSPEDRPLLDERNWRLLEPYPRLAYAGSFTAMKDGGSQHLHRAVLRCAPGEQVDHRNSNGLDCRRGNLRLSTQTQNMQSRRRKFSSRTPYKGIHYRNGLWEAAIRSGGRSRYLGRFCSAEDAARAYDAAARESFGEFARTNF